MARFNAVFVTLLVMFCYSSTVNADGTVSLLSSSLTGDCVEGYKTDECSKNCAQTYTVTQNFLVDPMTITLSSTFASNTCSCAVGTGTFDDTGSTNATGTWDGLVPFTLSLVNDGGSIVRFDSGTLCAASYRVTSGTVLMAELAMPSPAGAERLRSSLLVVFTTVILSAVWML